MRSVLVWLAALLAGCAAERPLQRSEFTRLCMGVQTRIILYAPSEQAAFSAASAAFDRINQLDALMSDYQRRSELNRLSDSAGGEPVAISDDLFDVLSISNTIATQTGGAFDPTIGPAVQLWRGARRSGSLPSESELLLARGLVNYRNLVLDPVARTARLTVPGMRLDLGESARDTQPNRLLSSLRPEELLAASWRSLVISSSVNRRRAHRAGPSWSAESRTRVSHAERPAQRSRSPAARSPHPVIPRSSSRSTAGATHTSATRVPDSASRPDAQSRSSRPRGEISDALATAACILGPVSVEPVLAQHPRVAAIFEEQGPDRPETSLYDPDHLITWVMLPQ
jgi:thiamine biosynthesis lipoprotein